jgi:hypothetical protein
MLIVVGIEYSKDKADDVLFEFEASGDFHCSLKFG